VFRIHNISSLKTRIC